ncbi:hypothetical protein ABZZ37_18645 [Streptomyces sp. NPDC006464]|uniref:hypothetical protein n=1 Tax=Streptomyces sp. NPDC006464 TaxID=3154305 RepID=UPI0033B44A99
MSVPEIIPIRHEPDYRTSIIGLWQGGRFFASITAAFPEGWSGDDWLVPEALMRRAPSVRPKSSEE